MYENISNAIKGETTSKEAESLEQAYEQLYSEVSRLQDMDDFTTDMLTRIYESIQGGASIEASFRQVLNSSYEFADYEYFENVVTKYSNELKDCLDKAVQSVTMEKEWSIQVTWLYEHITISLQGKEYTIEELQKMIEQSNITPIDEPDKGGDI